MRMTLTTGFMVGAALAATAQTLPTQAPGSHDPAKVEAGTYATDPEHTQIDFSVNHLGFSTYYGRFAHPTGTLTLDPKKLASAAVEVSFPTDSISTTNTVLDGELKGVDWLDAGKYPTVTFKSTKVTPKGHDEATVAGDLTLHGMTKPVTLTATFVGTGANPLSKKVTVGFDATGTLKRSDFGVTKYVPLIGDEVSLHLSGAFEKQ